VRSVNLLDVRRELVIGELCPSCCLSRDNRVAYVVVIFLTNFDRDCGELRGQSQGHIV